MFKSMTVTMKDDAWQTNLACVLESALRLHAEGDERLARELLDRIAPILAVAADSSNLDRMIKRTRRELGLPKIMESSRRQAEDRVRIGSPREGLRPVRARR